MSISNILQRYAAKNYEDLFTPEEGFLVYHKGNWQIEKILPEDCNEYRKEVMKILTRTKAWKYIPNEKSFANRLKNYDAVCSESPSASKAIILFNSKHGDYTFLSNYYQTIIEYKSHNNLLETRSYPSSENAYQAHKVAAAVRLKSKQLNNSSVHIYTNVTEEDLEKLATLPPSESKKLANELVFIEKTDANAAMKYNLMLSILQKKFTPGTKLAQKLLGTAASYLVEDTQDSFWGSKKTDLRSLDRFNSIPIKANSSNVLGRILMEVRTSLNPLSNTGPSTSTKKHTIKK